MGSGQHNSFIINKIAAIQVYPHSDREVFDRHQSPQLIDNKLNRLARPRSVDFFINCGKIARRVAIGS